jgi:hypothetical protein
MNTLKIGIINPKATKLLRDLEDLKLISISENSTASFSTVIKRLRSKSTSVPTLEEITKEVEFVRSKRYSK